LFYSIFLGILSYVTTSKFPTNYFSNVEIVLAIWIITLIIDEFRQFFVNMKNYFYIANNIFDLIIYLLFIIIIILRIIGVMYELSNINYISHMILLVSTIFCYLRILTILSASRIMGPIFFSIEAMAGDFLKFCLILAVFIVSFTFVFVGFFHESIDDDTWDELYPSGPLFLPMWATFGEFASSLPLLNQINPLGLVLLIIYLFLMQIILINLLIAMMNNSYYRVQENIDREWGFRMEKLIYEYEMASTIPPPFSIIQIILEIFFYFLPKYSIFEHHYVENDQFPFDKHKFTPEQAILKELNSKRNLFIEDRNTKKKQFGDM